MNQTDQTRRNVMSGKQRLASLSGNVPPPQIVKPPAPKVAKPIIGSEDAALSAEQRLRRREEDIERRENSLRAKEGSERAAAEIRARTETQLREANERLVIATMRAQTMTEAAEGLTAQMAYLAEHDFLTGLPNRTLLTARLTQAIEFMKLHGKKVALLYLDLDHFKQINDTLGHAVGDQLLQSAAIRLQSCVRLSDTVCRQGGDEFVILLAEIETVDDAILTAEKLIATMSQPHLIGEHRLEVTLSIGISLYPDDGKDVDAVVKNADAAMYHAKRSGRNNYQVFATDMHVRAKDLSFA